MATLESELWVDGRLYLKWKGERTPAVVKRLKGKKGVEIKTKFINDEGVVSDAESST